MGRVKIVDAEPRTLGGGRTGPVTDAELAELERQKAARMADDDRLARAEQAADDEDPDEENWEEELDDDGNVERVYVGPDDPRLERQLRALERPAPGKMFGLLLVVSEA